MKSTVVIRWSEEDQCFVVSLPEFTNVMQPCTHGDTYEEALKNAQEVLELLQDPVQITNWKFVETWIDPTSEIPYVLMLIGDEAGDYKVYDPKENYRVIYSSHSYEEVKTFLLEDEYEQIKGRYQDDAQEEVREQNRPNSLRIVC